MNHIIELAGRLGKAITDSPQAKSLRQAQEELNEHEDISKLLEEFQQQALKNAELEQAAKPVEVADKHNLRDLQDKLLASDVFKKFTAAQVEYVDLMRKVNEAMEKSLGRIECE